MKPLLIGLFLFLGVSVSFGQTDLYKGISPKIAKRIDLRPLPDKGTFITVQIAFLNKYRYLDGDDELLVKLMFLKPCYVKMNGEGAHLSLGLFNDYGTASTFQVEVMDFFMKSSPFLAAYSDGKRIPISDFYIGDVKESYPNIKKAKKNLYKQTKKDYFRIQIGYYEQVGYEPSEQEKFDIIKEKGFDVIEEPYKNGRVVVIDKKFTSLTEALEFQMMVEPWLDDDNKRWADDTEIKKYFSSDDLDEWYYYYMHLLKDDLISMEE